MNILYITHSGNLTYGAAQSLKYILQNVEYEYDLICTKSLYYEFGEKKLREYTGNKVNNIYPMWLPYEIDVVEISNKNALSIAKKMRGSARKYLTKIQSLISKIFIYKIINRNQYDLIHLNSIVLYPLISSRKKFVIHIRELYNGHNYKAFNKKISDASGIIFIDYAVQEAMNKVTVNKRIVLNNPIDMRYVKNISLDAVADKNGIDVLNKTIFAIIGVISPDKGVHFVIEAFKKINSNNIILLIVGDGYKPTVEHYKKIAGQDHRIIFTGQTDSIGGIYAISDYVIRADERFCIGRTVYEGLYAGCSVLMQGNENDYDKVFENEKFHEKIIFYEPRNEEDFIKKIKDLESKKIFTRSQSTNLDEYMNSLNAFYDLIDRG